MALWILPIGVALARAGLSPDTSSVIEAPPYLLIAVPVLMQLLRRKHVPSA